MCWSVCIDQIVDVTNTVVIDDVLICLYWSHCCLHRKKGFLLCFGLKDWGGRTTLRTGTRLERERHTHRYIYTYSYVYSVWNIYLWSVCVSTCVNGLIYAFLVITRLSMCIPVYSVWVCVYSVCIPVCTHSHTVSSSIAAAKTGNTPRDLWPDPHSTSAPCPEPKDPDASWEEEEAEPIWHK